MLREIIRELLVFVGAMTVLVALAGIIFNEICWGHWYGASQEQHRKKRTDCHTSVRTGSQ